MGGEIYISLKANSDKFGLIISDNGVGLPEEFDFENIGSLGLLLVNNLTEQIDGEIKINRKNGTSMIYLSRSWNTKIDCNCLNIDKNRIFNFKK